MYLVDIARKSSWRLVVGIALLLLVAVSARASPKVYRQALLLSIVWVVVPTADGVAWGTCWLADRARRLVVTCRHVVGDAHEVLVYFPCFKGARPIVQASYYLEHEPALLAQVIATDARSDLAVLRLASVPAGAQELRLAAEGCGPGDAVHSVGNSGVHSGLADGTLWWYTQGCVRQVDRRSVRTPEGIKTVRVIETQSPVNVGDSGGPVVDNEGRLVGVINSYTAGERLVSEDIDVSEVREFLERAPRTGAKEDAAKGPSVQGPWSLQVKGEGSSFTPGTLEFRHDGTFLLSSPGRSRAGRYAHLNGVLWLICDGAVALARPTWTGGDHFMLDAGKVQLTFERVKPARGHTAEGKAEKAPTKAGKEKAESGDRR
jgi:hypothetical protein